MGYFENLYAAFLGKTTNGGKEKFLTSEEYTYAITYLIIMIILFIASGFGAARLSYCYNMYLGNSTGITMVYSFFAFLLSGFYYPIYGLFLDPLCIPSSVQRGGKR